jgi:hypothetical protein
MKQPSNNYFWLIIDVLHFGIDGVKKELVQLDHIKALKQQSFFS